MKEILQKRMDFYLNNEKVKRFNSESRWNRIEKKHIHSIHRTDAASEICKSLIKNKDFIKERQIKALMGEETLKWSSLDPNRVMDLRHFNVRRHTKSLRPDFELSQQQNDQSKRKPSNGMADREQFQRMQDLNREIKKFQQNLENIRPKTIDLNGIETEHLTWSPEAKRMNKKSKIVMSLSMDQNRNKVETKSEIEDYSTLGITELDEVNVNSTPEIIISEPEAKRHEFNSNRKNSDEQNNEEMRSKTEMHLLQPNNNVELVITPSFSFDIQETRSNISIESSCEDTSSESRISLDQHMSILVRNLHLGSDVNQNGSMVVNENFATNPVGKATEKDNIINCLFQNQNGNDFIILQRYFLRWVHYSTVERLIRRNPDQSRLQKMQMFLHNITTERKKSLAKLRSTLNVKNSYETGMSRQHQKESPRLLMRKYNNKIRTQQDIIELQKMKLQRQERIIADLKLSKLFEDMSEAENHLKEGLKFVARNGCQNSRSKARCLQIAGKFKDGEDDETYQNLQAKGLSAPKFLIEMQARALEREIRHQQAQQRRETLEREKEALKIAAEEEKRLEDDESKRQRIRDLKRKRRQEKELEARRALERMKLLADLEKAKDFYRMRQYKNAIEKFKNLVNWRQRNERVSNAFRKRLVCRIWFKRWWNLTQHIWHERKRKADLCYRKHILRLGWIGLQNFYLIEHNKMLLADDWYDLHLSDRIFRIWHKKMIYQRMKFEIKLKQAQAHYNWQLRWKALEHWRHLHAILQIEKETEARRERWRSKIYDLIPDYTPNTFDT